MKKPTWKLLVGGLVIYFGLWGTIGSILSIVGTLSHQTEVHTKVIDELNDSGTAQTEPLDEPSPLFSDDPTWVIAISVGSLFVSVIYLMGGIALIRKPEGQRLLYSAIALSVLWAFMKTIPFTGGHPHLLLAVLPALAPSLIIDCILAGIVFVCTKYQLGKNALESQQVSTAAASSSLQSSKVNIPRVTGWFAAWCLAVLPFWIMGIPGIDNNYARGWKTGLDVIMYYPIAWIVVYGLFWLFKKYLPDTRRQTIDMGVSICLSLFMGLAILRLIQAFHIMAM